MSKKVFFAFSAGIGPLIRCLPIANELKENGYTVGYYAIDNTAKIMNEHGHVYVEFKPNKTPKILTNKNPKFPNFSSFYGALGYMDYEYVLDKIKNWQIALKNFKPDLIISDGSLEASIISRILKIPLLTITQAVFSPLIKMRWWDSSEESERQNQIVIENINKIFKQLMPCTNHQIEKVEDIFLGILNFVPSIPEMDPMQDNNTYFVGPILWDGFEVSDIDLLKKTYGKKYDKIITVYTGRMNDLGGGNSGEILLKLLIDSLKKNSALKIVLTNGGLDLISKGIKIPDNFYVFDRIPIELLYKSDLVIHHGGHGSCLGSLLFGVPSLVLPTHSEREYNARQLTKLGVSLFNNPRMPDDSITTQINQLLYDPIYYIHAKKWVNTIKDRNYKGANFVVDKIKNM